MNLQWKIRSGLFKPTVVHRMSLSILITIANFFLLYGLNLFLANQLGPEDYGDYAVAISTANFFALIATFGFEKLAARVLPQIWEKREHSVGHGLLRYTLLIIIAASVFIAISGVFIMGVLIKDGYTHPLFIAFWLIPLMAVVRIFSFWIQSTRHYLAAQAPNFLQEPLITFSLVYLIFILDLGITDFLSIGIVSVSLTATLLVQIFYLRKFLPRELFDYSPSYERKKWLGSALTMMFATLVFLGMQQTDIWLLELLGRDEHIVGYYGAISRTVMFYVLIAGNISFFLAPLISQYVESGQLQRLQKLVIVAQRFIILIAIVISGIILLYGQKIMAAFGHGFVAGSMALWVSAIGYGVNLIFCLSFTILQNAGYERHTLVISLMVLILHIVAQIFVIPLYGLLGAVTVGTLSLIFLYLYYASLVWYKLKLRLLPF